MKISPTKAKNFLNLVYRDGLAKAKASLREEIRSGDETARRLASAAGLAEDQKALLSEQTELTVAGVAWEVRRVLKERRYALLVEGLVSALLQGSDVTSAISTLSSVD